MLKVYGSMMCIDCVNCKKNFDAHNVEYEFYDINESLRNLSVFLDMRDHQPVFDKWKAIGDIGIPAIVKEDGEVFTDWETFLKELGYEIISGDGAACSID